MTNTEQDLLERIEKLTWYQSIPLGNGRVTPGETGESEKVKLDMMALPEDLSGKTLLDIGCNEGFFSFEAEKRGASRVLAMDKSPAAREKFMLLRKLFRSKVEFEAADLSGISAESLGRFDIILFLAVFHHLRYPFQAIDLVYSLTREFAVMEFVEAVPKSESDIAALVRKMSKKGHLHMLPTRQFTLDMLNRAGFSRIEVIGTHREHDPGAYRNMPGFSERRMLLKAWR